MYRVEGIVDEVGSTARKSADVALIGDLSE
jgi:hypothetical protein